MAAAVEVVGGQLCCRVGLGEPLPKALEWVVDRALIRRGLTGFDLGNATQRDQAVTVTLSASLSLLRQSERQRFAELAVFPEDAEVPLAAVETLWAATGGLDDFDSEELARKLFRISLLRDLDLAKRRLWLHDVIRAYLLPLGNEERDDWATGPDDGYFFQFLAYHLTEAGWPDDLKALLADYAWLAAKLKATDVQSVLADYERAPDESHLSLIKRALRLSTGALAQGIYHLPSQLLGRLRGFEDRQVQALLDQAEKAGAGPGTAWLCPHTASLLPPGPLSQRLFTGHSWVTALAVLPDRRVVSGSGDQTLRVWDVDSGASQVLKGHTEGVTALAVLPDGRMVSGSRDGAVLLWDLETANSMSAFVGDAAITACTAARVDCFVVGSANGAVHILEQRR